MRAKSRPNPNHTPARTAATIAPEMIGRIISSLSCIRIRYDCPTSAKLRPMRPIHVSLWRRRTVDRHGNVSRRAEEAVRCEGAERVRAPAREGRLDLDLAV